ncbi:unnamed protein product [Mesocestoides corti]|uniref:Uncharacterized protein n=1 Tax=Mesocestoides corti TaxID=53468 RepID=A0A0R3UGL2_MESCO|nr:unnamed protein product [Mesocestoides corti]
MSVPFSPGWNDPPALSIENSGYTPSRRQRVRVYHSVDGVGAAGRPAENSYPNVNQPLPPIAPTLPQPSAVLRDQRFPLQTFPSVMSQQTLPSQAVTCNTSTLARLAAQINGILGDTSLEIPGKDAILASLSSLQNVISTNRLSPYACELVEQLISFLESRDFKQAENIINLMGQQPEVRRKAR